ncbi:MAG: GH3 auxin-responsive promoter family protein [Candidatus Omnitrophota bacterium]|nr:GH3 auxin-responsive promoter family protein [Candidatus Omnitrophota bacterium]
MNLIRLLIRTRVFDSIRFDRAARDPIKTQKKLLFSIIKKNKRTLYGKEHGFSSIKTIEDFQNKVPVNNYESLRPYIKKMLKGQPNILTKDKPIFFGITSGTTNKPKFIPVTKRSRMQKSKIMSVWLYRLLSDHPETLGGKAFVVMSPAVEGYASSGVPYGSESGDAYKNMPALVSKHYALPYDVFCIKDYEARYYTMLRIGMGENVTNISTMNPLTILVLCQKISKYAKEIIEDIRKGTLNGSLIMDPGIRKNIEKTFKANPSRADFLEKLLKEKGALLPKDFWKDLVLIACWTGGTVGLYIKELTKYFPEGIKMRDFGYVSTEARVSVPVSDDGPSGVLTVGANFYEFIPEEDIEKKDPGYLTVDKLKKGRRYYIIFTTPSGLYRYNIDDIIRVVGFRGKAPVIEFIQKGKNVSSATGEKLYESQIISAIHKARQITGINVEFFCACLEWQIPPSYSFLVEFSEDPDSHQKKHFLGHIEDSLGGINIEYKAKRSSQRLGNPKLKVLEKGSFERFRKARLAILQHDSQFKASHLRCDFKIPPEFKIIEEILL